MFSARPTPELLMLRREYCHSLCNAAFPARRWELIINFHDMSESATTSGRHFWLDAAQYLRNHREFKIKLCVISLLFFTNSAWSIWFRFLKPSPYHTKLCTLIKFLLGIMKSDECESWVGSGSRLGVFADGMWSSFLQLLHSVQLHAYNSIKKFTMYALCDVFDAVKCQWTI